MFRRVEGVELGAEFGEDCCEGLVAFGEGLFELGDPRGRLGAALLMSGKICKAGSGVAALDDAAPVDSKEISTVARAASE